MAARPALPGDRPQRRDQHRPRQPGAGPGALLDRGAKPIAAELIDAGPLSPDGSDLLSLDEGLELLTSTGWDLAEALLAAIPEALTLRRAPHPHVATFRRRTAGFLAPWDGPAALVFADGRRVGAMVDRNGLRPASFAVTASGLVAVASRPGPCRSRRPRRSAADASGRVNCRLSTRPPPGARGRRGEGLILRDLPIHDDPRPTHEDRPARAPVHDPTLESPQLRYLAGLDAERARLDIKTMALEAHEPLWSMGDDTPTPGRARLDRPVADHLRQAFAQVTNPPIDPERERIVMDLRVEVGRRAALLGGPPRAAATLRLARPILADLDGLFASLVDGGRSVRRLDGRWLAADGQQGLATALERLAREAVEAAERGSDVLVISDRGFDAERLPVPSILAAGAVHTALTEAGLRGRTDLLVDAADLLDVHAAAMALAVGATAVHPRLAIAAAAAELAGTRRRGATPADTVGNLMTAFEAGLRKTLARMGISAVASYVGGALIDTLDLAPEVVARCFDGGRLAGSRHVRRARRPPAPPARRRARHPAPPPGREPRMPDPGFARFRGDGEAHLFAPRIVGEIQAIADTAASEPLETQLGRYGTRSAWSSADRAVPRDELRVRRAATPAPLGRGRVGARDRAPLRRFRHERRCAEPRGAPGAHHRDPAGRWRREHRRGVRIRRGTCPTRRAAVTTRRSSRWRRHASG